MRPIGLFNPKNATESSGGFKEGLVQVDSSVYKVHKSNVREGQEESQPKLALVWNVTRLDDDTKEPLMDDDGNPQTEEMVFSAGGKSLIHAHPGVSSSDTDEDIQDAGTEINAEGPTIFIVNPSWHPDKKSALINLQDSLVANGVKPETLDKTWAPDYVGAIVFVKSKPSGQTISRLSAKTGKYEDQTFSYKVVSRVDRGLCQGLKKKAAGGKSTANGKQVDAGDAEAKLKPMMEKLGEDNSGKSMTKKALAAHINRMMGEHNVPPPLVMPVMNLVKDDQWLTANGPKYEFAFTSTDNMVAFS